MNIYVIIVKLSYDNNLVNYYVFFINIPFG